MPLHDVHTRSFSSFRVAVVGYGSIGRRHYDNLGELGVTRRLAVRRQVVANAAPSPSIDVAVVHSNEAAMAAGVDLAIVCNPTSCHVDTALEYVAAGVPVLIEKPISDDLAAAEQLSTAAASGGVWAGMAYSLRYHPAYRLARELVLAGRIGRVSYAKAWFEGYLPDWHPGEDYRQSYAARRDLGGGALPTLDHELDYFNWCLGTAESVSRRTANSGALGIDADDTAMVTVCYPGNTLANAVFSLCRRDRSRGFEFVGSEATLRMQFETARLELVAGHRPAETLWQGAGYDLNDMYLEMLRGALTALAGGRPPPVALGAGVEALRLALGQTVGQVSNLP
ncbi:MAG TPA: Gfo/Idh/MocA family oxidoreductase [Pirellulales bacterium]|nr:Gfo/Idh/MocA family oxidoreductase [Pirellulales bacterium]